MRTTLGRNIWKKKYICIQEGVLFKFREKGSLCEEKFPLYKAKLNEYEPQIYNGAAFKITLIDSREIILKGSDQIDTQEYINAILRHRLLINNSLGSMNNQI